jgi:hypothetical protein
LQMLGFLWFVLVPAALKIGFLGDFFLQIRNRCFTAVRTVPLPLSHCHYPCHCHPFCVRLYFSWSGEKKKNLSLT